MGGTNILLMRFRSFTIEIKGSFSSFFQLIFYQGLFQTIYFFGFYDNCPRGKLPPNRETKPKPNPNPNRRTIFLGGNFLVAPNPKTNPDLDPNPNPNWGGAIFRRETIVRIPFFAMEFIYLRKKYY